MSESEKKYRKAKRKRALDCKRQAIVTRKASSQSLSVAMFEDSSWLRCFMQKKKKDKDKCCWLSHMLSGRSRVLEVRPQQSQEANLGGMYLIFPIWQGIQLISQEKGVKGSELKPWLTSQTAR
ncbi:hypothetical protein AKJ16_DCAP24780 [Drosera capensis]